MLAEAAGEDLHGRELEVVDRPLALAFPVDLTPCDPRRPLEVEGAPLPLQEHRQPFEAIGDLGRNELHIEAAELLEVRPLRDLHPVAPDLPPEAPGTQRRLLPVVLDEADVVAAHVDSYRLQRSEVEVEHVFRRRLEHDLVLKVMLEAVRVLAVPPVERADDGLDVAG